MKRRQPSNLDRLGMQLQIGLLQETVPLSLGEGVTRRAGRVNSVAGSNALEDSPVTTRIVSQELQNPPCSVRAMISSCSSSDRSQK